jgi:photosystem II stability/assembly factor-like uncharacterized protein
MTTRNRWREIVFGALISCLAFTVAAPASAGENFWTSVGPDGGKVTALAVHPTTPRVVYAGTSGGGVFKSTDGGRTWQAANTGLFNFFIRDLVLDPAAPETLYLSAGDLPNVAGVYKSTNGGASWINVSGGLPKPPPLCGCGGLLPITDLAIDLHGSHRLYAVAGGSVYLGPAWVPAGPGLETANGALTVETDPSSSTVVYAGTNRGVYKSTDAGAHWAAATSGLGSRPVRALAVDPRNPRNVYAGTDVGVFASTDAGASWLPASTGLTDRRVLDLALDPADPATLWAGTRQGLFESDDRGQSWHPVAGLQETVGVLAVAPSAPEVLYAGSGEVAEVRSGPGVFKSSDGGATWTVLSQGMTASEVTSMASAGVAGALWAGTAGQGVFRTDDGGASWRPASDGLTERLVLSLAADPSDLQVLYAGTARGIFKTTDGGASWTARNQGLTVPSTAGTIPAIEDLAVDPEHPATVLAAGSGGVYVSTDGGLSWRTTLTISRTPLSLAIAPSATATVYLGGGAGLGSDPSPSATTLFKSTDSGETWAPLGLSQQVFALAVDPRDADTVYAGTSGGVARSSDGGATWTVLSVGLEATITSLAFDSADPDILYAGSRFGVFRSRDGGTSWISLVQGMVNREVLDLIADPLSPGTIYAGTRGGGAYRLDRVACQAGETTLCLQKGRFRAEVAWRDFAGHTGVGHAVPLTPDTGAFWFFGAQNLELMVKVIDGRAVNQHFWVFYGALTNVEYTLTVSDTETGQVKTYFNPANRFASVGDTSAFTSVEFVNPSPESDASSAGPVISPAGACAPGDTALCLQGARFRVAVTWRDFAGNTGIGHAEPLTPDTGAFWFFGADNLELMVKVIDGRALNGKFWVFYGALSNVDYTITVTDTETGAVKTYHNPAGQFASVGDTQAF